MSSPTKTIDRRDLDNLTERLTDMLNNLYFFPGDVDEAAIKRALPAFLTELGIQVATPRPPAPQPRRRALPCLDKGTVFHLDDDTRDVPRQVHAIAAERITAYKAAHRGHYPPAPFDAGADSDRASVGLPGHCSVCAILGHVVTHPELGCGDVRCNSDHTGPGQITRHECTPDGKALPFGRKAPLGECLRCDQLRAGAPAREAHPAIKAVARRRADEEQTEAARKEHFAPGSPHSRGECGPVCTAFDY